jgi:diketogulonate reductase-like aldo/keto reductase
MQKEIIKRPIPTTKEQLPVVGLGTWQTFDVAENAPDLSALRDVLKTLNAHGGQVIDSSPMYGRSEAVVGDLSDEINLNSSFFLATKVWTQGRENGIRQMDESMRLLGRKKLDLMQIHNLTDWRTHLPTLRKWKEEGKIRYLGITHYTESAYPQIEQILRTTTIDFLQVNYSIMSRIAEQTILPLAQEKQVAVLINRPFEEGAVFQRVKGKKLPDWCAEADIKSWGQFFLKFILSNPAVTCVIPGTSKPHHMLDNISAGYGILPTDKQKADMIRYVS